MVNIFNFFKKKDKKDIPKVSYDSLPDYKAYAGQTSFSGFGYSINDGTKFPGGFGETQLLLTDYWTLRKRSAQLFEQNIYARGLIRRLITNEINTGLLPEARPDELIIGLPEDSLNDWTEEIENRFGIWAENSNVCDFYQNMTFGALQRQARLEALVSGDVLVVLRQSEIGLPTIQLIKGERVCDPTIFGSAANIPEGHYIKHGVEFDKNNKVFAHWVQDDDIGSFERVLAYGARSKRRISWLVYGTDKRLDDVRGQPLLSLVLQSLQEIDRYRDSTQRKATNNSLIAGFIEKSQDKIGSLPMQGGATRKSSVSVADSDGGERKLNIASQIPGMFVEDMQTGETIKLLAGNGTDLSFSQFEETITQAVAWANEMPPEIYRLAFSSNYSASQAAINEFKIYINKKWSEWGDGFCNPIYQEWLLSQALLGKIKTGSMLDAWRDPKQYDIYGAWVACDWYGSIKPSTDMLKQAKGSKLLVDDGWSTNAREARVTTGTKFSKNIKRLKKENQLKVDAMRPLMELKKEFGEIPNDTDIDDIVENPTN